MKGDFGFAFAPSKMREYPKGKYMKDNVLTLSANDDRIRTEMTKMGNAARRRFNVLNIDKDFPKSVDNRIGLRGQEKATWANLKRIQIGLYEQWIARLNTCSESPSFSNPGIHFDCRNAATAKRTLRGNDAMQPLSGSSMDRFMFAGKDTWIGAEYCDFFNSTSLAEFRKSDGVFFTDPHFRRVEEGPDEFTVRQYIRPDLGRFTIPAGKSVPSGAFYEHYETVNGQEGMKFVNPEMSIKAKEN